MTNRFAVIGNPIAHSLSPIIHQCFAKQEQIQLTYEKVKGDNDVFEQNVSDFFSQGGKGLNVTLPFKQRAYAMAQQRTSRCEQAGAANVLWMNDKQLHADNTDGIGFIRDLTCSTQVHKKRILILGAGGAARGIITPLLEQHPSQIVVANRTLSKAKEFQHAFPQTTCTSFDELQGPFDLVINATSISLEKDFSCVPTACFSAKPFCYDLSYKQHDETAFVRYAKNLGCEAIDGLGMLVEQAAEAFFLWHGVKPETQDVLAFLRPTQMSGLNNDKRL